MATKPTTPRRDGIREVPREMLERGREMAGVGRDVWLAGLGVLAVAGEQKGHLFDELVKAGEELEKKGKGELTARQKKLADTLEEQVYAPVLSALRKVGVTGRGEMRQLSARLDRITRRVDELVARITHDGQGDGAPAGTVKVFRVFADEGGWAVRRGEEETPMAIHPTKDEALEDARKRARESQPSRLDVYRKDGTLQDSLAF